MTNNLLSDFTVDKAAKTIYITREFAAELDLVWDAFSKQEILDQWWAPHPLISRTISMDFKVGGQRFYAMVWPEGQEHYGIQKFTSITPKTNLKMVSSFTDKDGNINAELPTSEWELNFTEENGPDGYRGTKVAIAIKQKTLADIEMVIQMGFKEGFTMTLNELTSLLKTLKK